MNAWLIFAQSSQFWIILSFGFFLAGVRIWVWPYIMQSLKRHRQHVKDTFDRLEQQLQGLQKRQMDAETAHKKAKATVEDVHHQTRKLIDVMRKDHAAKRSKKQYDMQQSIHMTMNYQTKIFHEHVLQQSIHTVLDQVAEDFRAHPELQEQFLENLMHAMRYYS